MTREILDSRRSWRLDGNRRAMLVLVACSILVALGAAREWDQEQKDEWQARLLAGKPVTVRFICGTDNPFDCKSTYEVSYSTAPKLCEHVSVDGGYDRTGWCNGDPSQHTLSITGCVLRFDRFGTVRLASKLVGQLFVPK